MDECKPLKWGVPVRRRWPVDMERQRCLDDEARWKEEDERLERRRRSEARRAAEAEAEVERLRQPALTPEEEEEQRRSRRRSSMCSR